MISGGSLESRFDLLSSVERAPQVQMTEFWCCFDFSASISPAILTQQVARAYQHGCRRHAGNKANCSTLYPEGGKRVDTYGPPRKLLRVSDDDCLDAVQYVSAPPAAGRRRWHPKPPVQRPNRQIQNQSHAATTFVDRDGRGGSFQGEQKHLSTSNARARRVRSRSRRSE